VVPAPLDDLKKDLARMPPDEGLQEQLGHAVQDLPVDEDAVALQRVEVQPVAGQAEASSMVTSIIVSLPSSDPPKRFGVMRPYMPFSRRSVTFSAGKRRSRSVSATRSRSLGFKPRARSMASS
jgi:hypothetical protein